MVICNATQKSVYHLHIQSDSCFAVVTKSALSSSYNLLLFFFFKYRLYVDAIVQTFRRIKNILQSQIDSDEEEGEWCWKEGDT